MSFILLLLTFLNPTLTQGGDDPILQGRSFEDWEKDLKSNEPNKKIPAIVVMGLLGPKAKETVPAICLALRDRDVEMRVAAAEALGRIGPDDQSFAALLTAEADPDPDVRRIVGVALARLYPALKDRVDAMLRAATTNSPARQPAMMSLMQLRTADRDTVLMLVERLSDPTDRSANLASSTLGRLGPAAKDAVPPLLSLLQESKDVRLRVQVINALGGMRQEERLVVPALAKRFVSREASSAEKRAVTMALTRFGPAAREALPVLRAALDDRDVLMRLDAAAAVVKIDPQDAQAVPVIVAAMRQGDERQRLQAANLLSQIGPAAKAAVKELGEALADSNTGIAQQAAAALSNLRTEAKPVEPALVKATNHPNRTVREQALRALVNLQPTEKEAVDRLLVLLTDPDPRIRMLANEALTASRAKEGGAKTQYRHLLTLEDRLRRKEAFKLARDQLHIQPEIVEVLVELLNHESTDIRQDAARLLGTASRSTSRLDLVPRLKVALDDPDETVRIWVAIGLKESAAKGEALPVLLIGLRHKDAEVRYAVRMALQTYGPAAKAALPIYLEWLKAVDTTENWQGAIGISQLGKEAQSALPALTEALVKKPSTRRYLLPLVGFFGPDAKPALPPVRSLARQGMGVGKDEEVLEAALAWLRIEPAEKEPRTILEGFTRHPQPRLQEKALEALGKPRPIRISGNIIPDPSLPKEPAALRKLLDHADAQVCQHALVALTFQQEHMHPDVLAALPRLLRSHDQTLRMQTASVIPTANPDGTKGVPLLQEFLNDKDERVRAAVVASLGRYGAKAKVALPALKKMLHDAPAGVQIAAALAVWQIDSQCTEGVEVLINLARMPALGNQTSSWRQQAVFTLGHFGPAAAPAVPHLIRLLDEANLKQASIMVLGKIGPSAQAAAPDLRRLVTDPQERDRLWAAEALWRVAPPAPEALKVLIEAFRNHPDNSLRGSSASVLGTLGPLAAKEVIPVLIEALQEADGRHMNGVISALGEYGTEARPAVPLLEDRLKQPAYAVTAAKSLLQIDARHAGALDCCRRALAADRTRLRTIQTLANLGPQAKELLPELRQLAESKEEKVRREAQTAVGKIDPSPKR
jgi:HEAT repeat protein